MSENENRLRELVAEVAAAYFANSHVNSAEIPNVINQIASSLSSVGEQPEAPIEPQAPSQTRATPAQIRKSMTQDGLVSFEDGRTYKTLRRHLAGRGLSPDQYRQKYGLPSDYPMVAPSYSAKRSELAKSFGLGQMGGRRAENASDPTPAVEAHQPAPKKRGRKATGESA